MNAQTKTRTARTDSVPVAQVHDFALPWEDRRPDGIQFKKWLLGCLSFVLVVGLVMPW